MARKCKKGFPCGNTCISKSRVCKEKAEKAAAALLTDLENAVKKTTKKKQPKPQDKKRAENISKRLNAIPAKPLPEGEIKDSSKASDISTEMSRIPAKPLPSGNVQDKKKNKKLTFSDAVKQIQSNPKLSSNPKNLVAIGKSLSKGADFPDRTQEEKDLLTSLSERTKAKNTKNKEYADDYQKYSKLKKEREEKEKESYDKLVGNIKKLKQSKVNDEVLSKVNFDDSLGEQKALVEKDVKEAGELIGSNIFNTMKKFVSDKPRAYATATKVNVGKGKNEEALKKSIFHEMAHHIEFNNPSLMEASQKYRDSKAKSMEQKKLSEITGRDVYSDKEKALEGEYFTPYMGKVYETGNTEILSIGFENFSSPKKLGEMSRKDPELFHFIVGSLLANN